MKFFEYKICWFDNYERTETVKVTVDLVSEKFLIAKCDLKVTELQQFPLFDDKFKVKGV